MEQSQNIGAIASAALPTIIKSIVVTGQLFVISSVPQRRCRNNIYVCATDSSILSPTFSRCQRCVRDGSTNPTRTLVISPTSSATLIYKQHQENKSN